MAEGHPTNRDWVLFDPLLVKPPIGEVLLLINEGGTLITGPWAEGCLAWGKKPIIPASVKARQTAKLQALRKIPPLRH